MRIFRWLRPRRALAVLLLLLVAGGGIAGAVVAQKPPPGAVDAPMHCAPWRPDYTPDPTLPPPTEVRATRDGNRVLLTWRDVTERETCLGILRVLPPPVGPSSEEQVTLIHVVPANATETSVTAPAADRACFAVFAGNAVGRSAPSNLACPDPPVLPPGPPPLSTVLLAPNRERLAICVDGVGDAAAAISEVRRLVEQALANVARHPAFVQAGIGRVAPVVEEGCPHAPYLLEPDVFWENGIPITGVGRVVPVASRYRLFLFLLPPEELARVIQGGRDIRRTAEEMLCQGHQCWQVTTGVYLTPEETRDEPFLVEWLTKGLGLEPAVPLVSPADVPRGP